MRSKIFLLMFALLCAVFPACSRTTLAEGNLKTLAQKAVSSNPAVASSAMASLREAGPQGLQALFEVHAKTIEKHLAELSAGTVKTSDPAWQRLATALDTVGQQKDCFLSELYWYTDLEKAKTAAQSSGKPILSLRLLGKLNDEYSCANSRFFRTILYSNTEISKVLRENYILHWKSVRPVPRITVDFGDGRKIERTITGNSIHYILDSQGQIVDALPGLYGPQAFLNELGQAEKLAKQLNGTESAGRDLLLSQILNTNSQAVQKQWEKDLGLVGKRNPLQPVRQVSTSNNPPNAVAAMPVAATKMIVERPLVKSLVLDLKALENQTDNETWEKIASLHADQSKLDNHSTMLIRSKNPYVCESPNSKTPTLTTEQLSQLVKNFEKAVALDTVKNEYLLRPKIRTWIAKGELKGDLEAFNEKVYSELFLTPSSDPWLGLVSPDTYTALEHDGIKQ